MFTKKTYTIPIVITIDYDEQYSFNEAKFIAGIIRDKIRSAMNNQNSITKWQIDLPNETETNI